MAQIPKIIEFLGKNPFEAKSENFGEKLRSYRCMKGLSQKKFAMQLGVDSTTLAGWERGEHRPIKKLLEKLISKMNSVFSP